jgi:hypothetical protein
MRSMKPRNIDVNGKTRPASTQGIATPKATKGSVKETEGIIKGDPKKAGEGLIQQQHGDKTR